MCVDKCIDMYVDICIQDLHGDIAVDGKQLSLSLGHSRRTSQPLLTYHKISMVFGPQLRATCRTAHRRPCISACAVHVAYRMASDNAACVSQACCISHACCIYVAQSMWHSAIGRSMPMLHIAMLYGMLHIAMLYGMLHRHGMVGMGAA